jgi:hypothetical protein
VPVKPTALEQNRTRQSPAALNITENSKWVDAGVTPFPIQIDLWHECIGT